MQKKTNRILLTIEYVVLCLHIDCLLIDEASLTTSVLSEAVSADASVIISYHPTIFKGLQSLTLSNPLQASLLRCAAEGISVYTPHTALDSVWGGINDWLAEGVLSGDSGKVAALEGEKFGSDGTSEGAEGRLVNFTESMSMKLLESRIKEHLGLSQSLSSGSSIHLSLTSWYDSPSCISFACQKHNIRFKCGDMRRIRWLDASWQGCRRVPYRRNVPCEPLHGRGALRLY